MQKSIKIRFQGQRRKISPSLLPSRRCDTRPLRDRPIPIARLVNSLKYHRLERRSRVLQSPAQHRSVHLFSGIGKLNPGNSFGGRWKRRSRKPLNIIIINHKFFAALSSAPAEAFAWGILHAITASSPIVSLTLKGRKVFFSVSKVRHMTGKPSKYFHGHRSR